MAKPKSKIIISIIFLLIVVLSAFTRLYRIQSTHSFHNDEGRDVLVALKMIETRKPILLGPQTSTGNMYLGPLYYYLMVPSLLLSNYDPVGPAVMVGLFGIATTALIFILSKRWIGTKGAIISSVVFATMPIIVIFTRNSWNPNIIPFFSVLVIWLTDNLQKDMLSKSKWLAMGALAGILIQLHYVSIMIVAISLLYLGITNKTKLKYILKGLFFVLLGFLLLTSPFWLFEIRHNWINTQALLSYLHTQSNADNGVSAHYFKRFWKNILDFTNILVGTKPNNPNAIPLYIRLAYWIELAFLALILRSTTFLNKKRISYLLIVILGSLVSYSLLHQKLEIHYLSYLFPVFAITLGYGMVQKGLSRYLIVLLTCLILVYNTPLLIAQLNISPSHQIDRTKEVATYIANDVNLTNYNVVPGGNNSRDATYSYYLALLDNKPSLQLENTIYMICEDEPCKQSDIDSSLIFARGPTHPSIEEYLGHPYINEYNLPRELISMEHIVYGVWVAKIHINLN